LKIKLIMPAWPKSSLWGKLGSGIPSLSLATIAALTPPGHDIEIIYDEKGPINYDAPCDIAGITGMTPVSKRAYAIAAEFKKRGVLTVMGGIHATMAPEEAGEHFDCVIVGEGERTWQQLLADHEKGAVKKFYRNDGMIDLTTESPVPRLDYYKGKGFFLPNIIQTTRGCPYNCEFCTVTEFFGRSYRHKSHEQIVREIEAMDRDRFRGNEVFFCDDNIVANRRFLMRMCDDITPFKLNWYAQSTAAVTEDDEVLAKLEQSGCKVLFIGFDSLNQESLEGIDKGHNVVTKYADAVKKLHDHGISIHGSFMFGFDHDDINVFQKFLDFGQKVKLDAAFLTVVTPFPGTRIHERMKAEGRIFDFDWERYDISTVVYKPARLTVQELQEGYWWMFREFHTFPNIFRRLWGSTPSWMINPGSNMVFKVFGGRTFPKVKDIGRFTGKPSSRI